jgi:hypothetical protein
MYGWTKLYTPVVRFIEDNGGKILQMKEKFGELRIYWNSSDTMTDDIYEVIDLAVGHAEHLSRSICIECGKTAHLYTDGWMLPLCDEHAAVQGRNKTTALKPTLYTSRYEMPPEQNPEGT